MDRHELFGKISTFPFVAWDLAEDLLSGEYRSIFKGSGVEFDEVRPYDAGDDVRSIDWNVSARFGTPFVKMYREERELTVCIVLDCSASMRSGSGVLTRYEQGVLAAALLAFSAERAGQRVGAVFFDEEILRVFSPRKGRAHIMALVSAALDAGSGKGGSGLGRALEGTGRFLKRRSLVALISDFFCANWERELKGLCGDHDVIALRITDPLDLDMPGAGLLSMKDAETGLSIHAPTGFSAFRSAWVEWHKEREDLWRAICRRSGAAAMELSTAEDAAAVLSRFFGVSAGRPRRHSSGRFR